MKTILPFQNDVVMYRNDHRLFYETELVSEQPRDITRSLQPHQPRARRT